MKEVVRNAHAKLNVFLRVLGARVDAYHEIQTVILPVDLYDVVTARPAEGLTVEVSGPRGAELADAGGESLVARAALAWAEAVERDAPDALICIDKRIPVSAGLGGGSADAAATILALDELHGTDLDLQAQLDIATAVGSDVAALLLGGAAYAAGRGERVSPIHVQTTYWAIAPAPFEVRTPDAYAWWDEAGSVGPDPGAVIAAIESGNDDVLGEGLFDDLQPVVAAHHPWVGKTVAAFEEAGALGAVMTGSGPTVVALARHLAHADELARVVPGAFVAVGPPRTMGPPSGVV